MNSEELLTNPRINTQDNITFAPAQSDDIRQIAAAILRAKNKFRPTGKNSQVTYGAKYRYAKIEDIYAAVENALYSEEIFLHHFHYSRFDGQEGLITILTHMPSQQFIRDVRILISEKPGMQGMGSASTYIKKQAIQTLCAIAQEDDDGEEESRYIEQKQYDKKQQQQFTQSKSPYITPEQLEQLEDALQGFPQVAKKVLKGMNIDDLSEMPKDTFIRDIKRIRELVQEEKIKASI